jgi:hypothetical protein
VIPSLVVSAPTPTIPAPPTPGDFGVDWARPEQHNAVADGTTDDTAAVQAALDDGRPVLLTGNYRVSGLVHSNGAPIISVGPNAFLRTLANAPILHVTTAAILRDLRLLGTTPGGAEDLGPTQQQGIWLDGARGAWVDGLVAAELGGAACLVENTAGSTQGVLITQPRITHCNDAFFARNSGEYVQVHDGLVYTCHRGAHVLAGNFHWTGGSCTYGRSAVWVGPGVNDGHGLIQGVALNHQVAHALHFDGVIANGFTIDGCRIYGGAAVFTGDTRGINLTRCEISALQFYLGGMTGNARLILDAIQWVTPGSSVVTAAPNPAWVVQTNGRSHLTGLPSTGPF